MTIQEDIKIKRKELLQLRAEALSQHLPLNDNHTIGHDINCQLCKLYNQIVTDDELLKEELEILRVDDLIIDEFNSMRNHLGEIPKIGHFVNNHANDIGERFGSWDNFFKKADNKFNQRK